MVIGIGGVSNSGKSELAAIIKKSYPDKKTKILCQDQFVYPSDKIPKIKGHINWELPASINFRQFRDEILHASKSHDLVIAEGLMVLHRPEINKYFDKLIFINLTKESFLKRKLNDLRWGHEPLWYIHHIWYSYLQFGQAPPNKNLLFVNGEISFPVDYILDFLNH